MNPPARHSLAAGVAFVAAVLGLVSGLSAQTPSAPPSAAVWQSPAELEAWLRANGAPLPLRFQMVHALVQEKYRAAYEAARFPGEMKRWQRGASRPTPEQREQMNVIRRRQQEELQQIFGAEYAKARFGEDTAARSGIPPEKWVEINRINQENIQARLTAGASAENRKEFEEKRNAELAAVLTPQELEAFQAYESQEGSVLQRAMAGLDVDDDTYLRIYRAMMGARAKNPALAQTSAGRLAEYEAIAQVAGTGVAMHIAVNQDGSFREMRNVYDAAGLPAGEVFERYKAWMNFHREHADFKSISAADPDAAQLESIRAYHDRLTAGFDDAQLRAFDRTRTGMFMKRLRETRTPARQP